MVGPARTVWGSPPKSASSVNKSAISDSGNDIEIFDGLSEQITKKISWPATSMATNQDRGYGHCACRKDSVTATYFQRTAVS